MMNIRSLARSFVIDASSETWLVRVVAALLFYVSWACGGTPVSLQFPLPCFGLIFLFLIFFLPSAYRERGYTGKSLAGIAVRLAKDPVFITGGLFLLLLAIQWWNAGRYLFFNPVHKAWEYTAPGVAWLPSAFSRADASEMLAWFFPAWALVLAIRHPGMSPGGIRRLWRLAAVNSGLLALFGILQYMTGASGVFWAHRPGAIFFSSFWYANHAGAFFTLMFCMSAGFCIRELFSRTSFHWDTKNSIMLAATALNLTGATFSLSRVGTILAWSATILLVIYTIVGGWHRMTPVRRLNLSAAVVGAVCFLFFVVAGWPGRAVLAELSTLSAYSPAILLENGRLILMRAAVEIWREAPWFGVGGWGFAYLFTIHVPNWPGPATPGLANVHNDPLQFLAEFGAVGTVLLFATVVTLALPIFRTELRKHPLAFGAALGLVATLIHSLVDLPFRCPAILFSWLTILAGAGILCRAYCENDEFAKLTRGGDGNAKRGSRRRRWKCNQTPPA